MNPIPRRSPNANRYRISVPASYAGLKDLYDSCQQLADRCTFDETVRHDMYVAVEELVSNIIRHQPASAIRQRVTLSVSLTADALRITVADNAAAFNPLDVPAPDLATPLEERELGGLGIHLVKSLMDDVRYRRQNNRNHVRLTKKVTSPPPS